MGLDNGIVLEAYKYDIPKRIQKLADVVTENKIYLCYWRRCWQIRNLAIDIHFLKKDKEKGIYYLDYESAKQLRLIIKHFSNSRLWEKTEPYWSFYTMKKIFRKQRKILKWLEKYLRNNPEAVCYFYDSY